MEDNLNQSTFVLEKSDFNEANEAPQTKPEQIDAAVEKRQHTESEIVVDEKVEEISVEVVQHIPSGQWKNITRNKDTKIGGPISC